MTTDTALNLSNLPEQSIQSFSTRLLDWFDNHGRHDLPWQQHKITTPNTYHVWLSEVMLQQTQVTTVIPYFQRFIASFPTVHDLAHADWDLVAEHWAGLGYYARARNLHKGAKQLVDIIKQTGELPQTVEDWETIAGVGRSTAGAIVAMGLHKYGVICDGNVKRVLTRWAGINGDISKSATNKQLWALAEELTPQQNSGHYAQAMMDMGATVCMRTKPACLSAEVLCPLRFDCVAYAKGKQLSYPVKAKKQPKPSKLSTALLITNPQAKTLWLQRPETGIWGGLWCLPLQFIHKVSGNHKLTNSLSTDAIHAGVTNKVYDASVYEKEYNTAEQIIDQFLTANQILVDAEDTLTNSSDNPVIKHTLTHFHWYLSKRTVALTTAESQNLSTLLNKAHINYQWLSTEAAVNKLALPKAMVRLFADQPS